MLDKSVSQATSRRRPSDKPASQGRIALASLLLLSAGCGALFDQPTGGGPMLAVFDDPDSGFSTSDVYDIDNEIVRFDVDAKTIIWALDGTAFEPGTWEVNGNFLRQGSPFQVRFGNADGERRAYFTETGPATICDIAVSGDALLILRTDTPVPQ